MIQIDVISGANAGLNQQFSQQSIRIGRQAGNDLNLNDNRVSSNHCVISVEGGNVYVTDLNSTNGTFVSGRRVTAKAPIFPGDQIQIGDTVIRCSVLQQQVVTPQPVQQPQAMPQQQYSTPPPQMQTPQQPMPMQQQAPGVAQQKRPSQAGTVFKYGCSGLWMAVAVGLIVAMFLLASVIKPVSDFLRMILGWIGLGG